jgi:hypothetical protein
MGKNLENGKQKLDLRILIDTSVLFSKSIYSPINYELQKLIEDCKKLTELRVTWYIPDVVIDERKYQIKNQVKELLQATTKLYRFLGRNLDVNLNTITEQIDKNFENYLINNNLTVHKLNVVDVDWNNLIKCSTDRLPPFQSGDKEKGFRDALIIENYLQLLSEFGKVPGLFRVMLATKDKLQKNTALERMKNKINSQPPGNIDDIKELIKVLSSKIDEVETEKVRELASALFYQINDKETLYYAARIRETIEEKYLKQLLNVPEGAEYRINSDWEISLPEYKDKKGKRWTWISKISQEHNAYKSIPIQPPQFMSQYATGSFVKVGPNAEGTILPTEYSGGTIPIYLTPAGPSGSFMQNIPSGGSITYPSESIPSSIIIVATGKIDFEVQWSFDITDETTIEQTNIDEIRFIQDKWLDLL